MNEMNNTYFVEVNNKYLIRLESDGGACAAEHFFLDTFKGVWAANAFDIDSLKTDCFVGALLHDTIISVGQLAEMASDYEDAKKNVDDSEAILSDTEDEIKDLYEKIALLKAIKAEQKERLNDAKENLEEVKKLLNVQRPY